MTATQRFIEKAIEGGWKSEEKPYYDRLDNWVDFRSGVVHMSIYEMLLDPEAWKAVGKVEGWPCKHEDGVMTPVGGGWLWHMHRMTDALAAEKTIEEYLSTIV